MNSMQNGPDIPRVGIPDAVNKVLSVLSEGSRFSISDLARRTGLDRRTVDKVLEMILEVQRTLSIKKLTKKRIGRSYAVSLRERTKKAKDLISEAGKRLKRSRD
ncbi:hypothetical protein EU538_02540 [Candidatus Thorarchaeota archaeon]|jgi:DNA-binding IclR family transcriptional regulator|nr:MAG: hypothetical protein EU538_02540 [Candidatus Thorarchaeota archaeon]